MGNNKFNPSIQVRGLRAMEQEGYIKHFCYKRDLWGNYKFSFWLTQQSIDGEDVETDFSRYKIRVEYVKTLEPKVFIEEPGLKKAKHRYKDERLCLYHPSNFKWGDDKSIAFNLLPWIYMWIFYNEIWLKTGKWHGDEYQH